MDAPVTFQAILLLVACREEHGPHVWVGDLELTPPSAAFGEFSVTKSVTCLGHYFVLPAHSKLACSWVITHTNQFVHICLQQSLLLCRSECTVCVA